MSIRDKLLYANFNNPRSLIQNLGVAGWKSGHFLLRNKILILWKMLGIKIPGDRLCI